MGHLHLDARLIRALSCISLREGRCLAFPPDCGRWGIAVGREGVNRCCNGYRATVLNPMSNPQFLTFGAAERRFRIAKATLSRDRSKGKLSAERQEDGSYRVAVSELIRVYWDRVKPETAATGDDNRAVERSSTPPATPATGILQAQLDGLRGELEQVRSERDDLRRRLDSADGERREKDRLLTALLTDQRHEDVAPP